MVSKSFVAPYSKMRYSIAQILKDEGLFMTLQSSTQILMQESIKVV
jgi:hypothetical protein